MTCETCRTTFYFLPSNTLNHCVAPLLRIVDSGRHKELGRRTGRRSSLKEQTPARGENQGRGGKQKKNEREDGSLPVPWCAPSKSLWPRRPPSAGLSRLGWWPEQPGRCRWRTRWKATSRPSWSGGTPQGPRQSHSGRKLRALKILLSNISA